MICLKTASFIEHRVSFLFMGNLNYIPENQLVHLSGSSNITFMSQG